ncbi:MAG: hypothetical protein IJG08_02135 [Oscillospiraceae bacterium]|nr:hypothetical protein [Oscillospiraceae bacterium]MBR3083686.1 hypothetical protein [Oscillospiraceae bacterium]
MVENNKEYLFTHMGGKSHQAQAAKVSTCRLKGNGHRPPKGAAGFIPMRSLTLEDYPGYISPQGERTPEP